MALQDHKLRSVPNDKNHIILKLSNAPTPKMHNTYKPKGKQWNYQDLHDTLKKCLGINFPHQHSNE